MSNRKPLGMEPGAIVAIFAGAQNATGDDFLSGIYWTKKIKAMEGFTYDEKSGAFTVLPTAPQEMFLNVKPSELNMIYRWAQWFVLNRNLSPMTLIALGDIAKKTGQMEVYLKLVEEVYAKADELDDDDEEEGVTPMPQETK